MQHILQIAVTYITTHHEAILALVGGAGGLSVGIQWFLHKFKINGAVASFTISHMFALATAAAAYILDSVHPNAGVTYGWIWFAAQFWHRLVLNPAYNKYVIPFLDWLSKQRNAAILTGPQGDYGATGDRSKLPNIAGTTEKAIDSDNVFE